jgi:hypothetical protein
MARKTRIEYHPRSVQYERAREKQILSISDPDWTNCPARFYRIRSP